MFKPFCDVCDKEIKVGEGPTRPTYMIFADEKNTKSTSAMLRVEILGQFHNACIENLLSGFKVPN